MEGKEGSSGRLMVQRERAGNYGLLEQVRRKTQQTRRQNLGMVDQPRMGSPSRLPLSAIKMHSPPSVCPSIYILPAFRRPDKQSVEKAQGEAEGGMR